MANQLVRSLYSINVYKAGEIGFEIVLTVGLCEGSGLIRSDPLQVSYRV